MDRFCLRVIQILTESSLVIGGIYCETYEFIGNDGVYSSVFCKGSDHEKFSCSRLVTTIQQFSLKSNFIFDMKARFSKKFWKRKEDNL